MVWCNNITNKALVQQPSLTEVCTGFFFHNGDDSILWEGIGEAEIFSTGAEDLIISKFPFPPYAVYASAAKCIGMGKCVGPANQAIALYPIY